MPIKKFCNIIFIPFLILIMVNCHNKQEKKAESPEESSPSDQEKALVLTAEQIKMAGIETGVPEFFILGKTIECTGKIIVPPDLKADVTTPVGGLVKYCLCHAGEYVSAGQIIAVLEHPDYIKIQQDFLEAKSQWEYYKEDFKRQGELTIENASSIKNLQQTQANYNTVEVRMIALKNQLKLLGIDSDTLSVENISSQINLKAPVSGYITDIQINLGKYVNAQQQVCEIINKSTLYLELSVYEKDIHLIKTGQKINFYLINDIYTPYSAVIKNISPKVNKDYNAFNVYAFIPKPESFFNPGMTVKAKISIDEHKVLTLPLSAIVNENNQHIAFMKTKDGFISVNIKTGIQSNERIEIVDLPDEFHNKEFVINGAYYLNALWHEQ